jgi:hypothetical protein
MENTSHRLSDLFSPLKKTSSPPSSPQYPENKLIQASGLASSFNDLTQKVGLVMKSEVDTDGCVTLKTPDGGDTSVVMWTDSNRVLVVDHPTKTTKSFNLVINTIYDILHHLLGLYYARVDLTELTDPDIAHRAEALHKALVTEYPGQKILKYIGPLTAEKPPVVIQQHQWRCIVEGDSYAIHLPGSKGVYPIIVPAEITVETMFEIIKLSKFIKT